MARSSVDLNIYGSPSFWSKDTAERLNTSSYWSKKFHIAKFAIEKFNMNNLKLQLVPKTFISTLRQATKEANKRKGKFTEKRISETALIN